MDEEPEGSGIGLELLARTAGRGDGFGPRMAATDPLGSRERTAISSAGFERPLDCLIRSRLHNSKRSSGPLVSRRSRPMSTMGNLSGGIAIFPSGESLTH